MVFPSDHVVDERVRPCTDQSRLAGTAIRDAKADFAFIGVRIVAEVYGPGFDSSGALLPAIGVVTIDTIPKYHVWS